MRFRSIIEDELGELPLLAEVPAAEIEAIAARLTRALTPFIDPKGGFGGPNPAA